MQKQNFYDVSFISKGLKAHRSSEILAAPSWMFEGCSHLLKYSSTLRGTIMPPAFLAELLFMCSPSHLPVYVTGKPLKHWKKELNSLATQVAKEFVTRVKTVKALNNAFSSFCGKLEENKKCFLLV